MGRALAEMLKTAGLSKQEVDGLSVSSFTAAPDGVIALTAQFGLTPRWTDQVVGGVIAMKRAARAVQTGDADIVACIAGDAHNSGSFGDLASNFSSFTRDAVFPMGGSGPNGVFAMNTRNYMSRFGAVREDFGRICIAQRYNAAASPHALLRKPLTMEEYLAARPVAEPLHLFDCVMPCAGGEGFLVMSEDRARFLKLPYASILSAMELHNAYPDDPIHERGGWAMFRDQLYTMAGVGPRDMDFLQTYDDYPVIVMLQLEDLGFCDKGEAARFVRETPLTIDGGGLPQNTCGGMLSAGQAGAAGQHLGIVEGIRQLTDARAPNRVPDARMGLVSGYGMAIYDHCLSTSAAIIVKGSHK
jgi:acetyl-CoA acetyltransferase